MASKSFVLLALAAALGSLTAPAAQGGPVRLASLAQGGPFRFSVTLPPALSSAVDGRLLVIVSRLADGEPRSQVSDGPAGQPVFGIDVENWAGAKPAVIDGSVLGFPLDSINDIPAGTYTVQALVHRYETFKRGDGHTVKMPMDRGEGQQWAARQAICTPRRSA